MALEFPTEIEIIEVMEGYLVNARPPEDIRDEIDINYVVDGQSVTVIEIQPDWQDNLKKIERPIAKATWIKATSNWKIFWMRGDLKWHAYEPRPTAKNLKIFVKVLEEDDHGCFWG